MDLRGVQNDLNREQLAHSLRPAFVLTLLRQRIFLIKG